MYKFNARFRTAVMAVADEMGLDFISTPQQVENGTLMFNDPIGKVKYAMYESGYVRRLVPSTIAQTPYPNKSGYAMYQLNKVIRNAHKSSIWNNKVYNYRGSQRVLSGPDEQLGILVKSVANWRKR
jgi:hypothetical protein